MEKNSNSQKEELAKRLAEQLEEDEKEKEKSNKIRANAYYLNFNAPQAGYYKVKTRISST